MTREGHIQVNSNTAQFASGKGGSIPTCAGQPLVYPHVCGAASVSAVWRCGLSPRVRGSHEWVYPHV